MTGDILDDLFHGCALDAFREVWRQTGQFPPDSEATRRLAYRYYEEALAEKDRLRGPLSGRPPRREAGQGCGAPEGGACTHPDPVGSEAENDLERRASSRVTGQGG